MTYQRTLEYLFSMLPMYQKVGKGAYKKDLHNTLALLDHLDNPQDKFKSIHIAGTNGKGTSAHGLAAVLQSAGYKTGLYTSPHLKNFTERIKINGEEVNRDFVVHFSEKIKVAIEEVKPSFFEVTVAMAFHYFAEQKVDIAIIETGLGGRLDSTNVINPEVCLITNIGLDHTDLLGDTIAKIAFEKAGIIKREIPIVIGEHHPESFPVFTDKANEMNAPLIEAKAFNYQIKKKNAPNYLQKNLDGILTVVNVLKEQGWAIADDHIALGLLEMNELTGLKGRYQVLGESPFIVADVSHNAEGIKILLDQVNDLIEDNHGRLHLIFGTVKDKSIDPILSLFPQFCTVYWTQSSVPRSLNVSDLRRFGSDHNIDGDEFAEVNEAIAKAKLIASSNDVILITGSTFVVAEIQDL